MLGKAWDWLRARLGGQPQGRLRFAVHLDPAYQSFWRPSDSSQRTPQMEIQIYLEARNMTNASRWMAGAQFAGMPANATVLIGVRDPSTGKFDAQNPLLPRRIAVVSLRFLIDGQSQSADQPFNVTLWLTDNVGERHSVKVIMH